MPHTPEHLLEESKRLEQEASKITGITPVLGSDLNSITAKDIASISTPTFKTPAPTPIPDISKLDSSIPAPAPKLELTPTEKAISEELKAIREGRIDEAERARFIAEREKVEGLPELKKTQRDLASRLKILQNEALAIPSQMEKEFAGRASIGSIQGFSREAVRQNTIQALGISAFLEASRGNITSAQELVDSAVEQKYGPLEREQKARLENLELLLKDPSLSIEQQNRANAQKVIEEKRTAQIALDKQNFEEARKESLKYAEVADALTLKEMEKAGSALEVAQIAQKKGLKTLKQQKEEIGLKKTEAEIKATLALTAQREKTEKLPADKVAFNLNAVGLKPSILMTGNKLTKGNADKIAAQGVPPSIIELITQAILEGDSLDEIRNALAQGHGKDVGFGYLDKYMGTLQGSGEIRNPFR